jgi:hypothetical protein
MKHLDRIKPLICGLFACLPAVVFAQPPAPLARADVTASAGWFMADRKPDNGCCNPFSAGLFKGAAAGFYWTDHLKTEVEVASPGETEGYHYSSERISPNVYRSINEEHAYTVSRVSIAQAYQFGRNATFHPFITGGVDIDRERDDVFRRVYEGGNGPSSETRRSETQTRVRPFVGTGFKAYVSERAFIRGDAHFATAGGSLDQAVLKVGVGIDFPSRRSAAVRAPEPVERWRALAEHLRPTEPVTITVAGGERFRADFIASDASGIVVQPKGRAGEPARHVPFDRLEQLALAGAATDADRVGAVAVGAGVATGVFWTLLFIVLSQID